MSKHVVIFCIALALSGVSYASALDINGVVDPITPCGGIGTLLEFHVTNCTVPPCILFPEREVLTEALFIAAQACPMLGFRLILIQEGGEIDLLDVAIPGSEVRPGATYMVRYPVLPDAILAGQRIQLMIQLYCTSTLMVEICVGAEAEVMRV